uniref:UPAR/Ly6 domain-containing protein n=1 Tax=Amphiprion percula TaxID=161767 RepID=A0A3P8S358_AMPPE
MNKLLWSCAALLTLFVAGKKSVLSASACAQMTTCNHEFSADLLSVHARGCIAAAACTNQTGSILTLNYSITRTCCSTNLCNGAAPAQLPLSAGLCAALVAVWSQFYN